MTVDSTFGEVTTFVAPTANLKISTGGGSDIVTIDGLNVTLSGEFAVDDPSLPKDDTVQFINNASNVKNGGLDLAVLNIDVNVDLNADFGVVRDVVPT